MVARAADGEHDAVLSTIPVGRWPLDTESDAVHQARYVVIFRFQSYIYKFIQLPFKQLSRMDPNNPDFMLNPNTYEWFNRYSLLIDEGEHQRLWSLRHGTIKPSRNGKKAAIKEVAKKYTI